MNVFGVEREEEKKRFKGEKRVTASWLSLCLNRSSSDNIRPQLPLFHGSRCSNFIGLLSRGILLPKVVVNRGGQRTDAGFLGAGIYFGDCACTAVQYTTEGSKGTRFILISRVAVGNAAEYTKIDTTITKPPAYYQSCHGVRNTDSRPSQFEDDEYVIYDEAQYKFEVMLSSIVICSEAKCDGLIQYLVEVKFANEPPPGRITQSLELQSPNLGDYEDSYFEVRKNACASQVCSGFP